MRARPVGDEDRRLAGIGERHRAGDFAVEQGRTKDLRREGDVVRADVEWRLVVVERGGGLRRSG